MFLLNGSSKISSFFWNISRQIYNKDSILQTEIKNNKSEICNESRFTLVIFIDLRLLPISCMF